MSVIQTQTVFEKSGCPGITRDKGMSLAGPLEGIRIIECTQWIQGPIAGVMLSDLGADIIKVEDYQAGDGTRGAIQSGIGAQTHQVERNYIFEACNRGKRSITLNLRQSEGRDVLYRLVAGADVFLHNWRGESVSRKLGADYETLAAVNPRIIYSYVSGWGPEGELRESQAYDLAAMARCGILHLCRQTDEPPVVFPGGIGDITGSMSGLIGILACLVSRDRTGKGQKVNTSLLGSLLQVLTLEIASSGVAGEEYPVRSRSRMGNPLYNHYACADGKWITFSMTQPDRYWHDFCAATGIAELETDPRFQDLSVRAENAVELIGILDRKMTEKTRDEWVNHFRESGSGIIYAPVQSIPEVLRDPQVVANRYVVDYDHPTYGPVTYPGVPHGFSETPTGATTAAPELGQHTEEILLELGYTWAEISALHEAGSI